MGGLKKTKNMASSTTLDQNLWNLGRTPKSECINLILKNKNGTFFFNNLNISSEKTICVGGTDDASTQTALVLLAENACRLPS